MLELKNHLEVDTPLGRGTAILVESADNDYYWTVILYDSRALVTFTQNQIRAARNYSSGWGMDDKDMKDIINGD